MSVCDQDVYGIGDSPVLVAVFSSAVINGAGGILANPTAVTFTVTPETTGPPVTYVMGTDSEVANPSTGVFVCTLPPVTVSQRYRVKVMGSGGIVATKTGEFVVTPD